MLPNWSTSRATSASARCPTRSGSLPRPRWTFPRRNAESRKRLNYRPACSPSTKAQGTAVNLRRQRVAAGHRESRHGDAAGGRELRRRAPTGAPSSTRSRPAWRRSPLPNWSSSRTPHRSGWCPRRPGSTRQGWSRRFADYAEGGGRGRQRDALGAGDGEAVGVDDLHRKGISAGHGERGRGLLGGVGAVGAERRSPARGRGRDGPLVEQVRLAGVVLSQDRECGRLAADGGRDRLRHGRRGIGRRLRSHQGGRRRPAGQWPEPFPLSISRGSSHSLRRTRFLVLNAWRERERLLMT